MKKILLLYVIVALIAIIITIGFLTTTRFAMVIEYSDYQQTYKETLIENASLKEYADGSKDLRDYFDEYADALMMFGSSMDGSMFSNISAAFSIARLISIFIGLDLLMAVIVTVAVFVVFLLSIILPKNGELYQKWLTPFDNGSKLFQGFFGLYAGALIAAAAAVHIPQWFMSFTMGENVVVRVVYTNGINYIWGALMIGVLMLVAKVIAKRLEKN